MPPSRALLGRGADTHNSKLWLIEKIHIWRQRTLEQGQEGRSQPRVCSRGGPWARGEWPPVQDGLNGLPVGGYLARVHPRKCLDVNEVYPWSSHVCHGGGTALTGPGQRGGQILVPHFLIQ